MPVYVGKSGFADAENSTMYYTWLVKRITTSQDEGLNLLEPFIYMKSFSGAPWFE